MKTIIYSIAVLPLCLGSCRDRDAEQREKEIEAAEHFDKQHNESMEDSTKIKFPEPKPAGPIR